MVGSKLIINLASDQQKQIRDATGRSVTALNIDLAARGHLTEKDLQQISGGAQEGRGSAG